MELYRKTNNSNDNINKLTIKRTNYRNIADQGKDSFLVTIGHAYYNSGFFNVRVKHSDFFGKDLTEIKIQLGENSNIFCQGAYVNRTANTNGTPRIMAGKMYRNWVKENFVQGDIFKVRIVEFDYIILSKPLEN